MENLTEANYFSQEMELKYCGSSQFKRFLDCPARAMAMLKGEWVEEKTESLLVGSYVDAYMSDCLDVFKEQNPEIFTQEKDGQKKLRAPYRKKAEDIIKRIENDELFKKYISGDNQRIFTGEIDGLPFKIKTDSFFEDKNVVTDLKVLKDFKPIYNEEKKEKENPIVYWHYDWQAAIYAEIVRQNTGKIPKYFIAAITKEKESDLAVVNIPEEELLLKLEIIKTLIPAVKAIKEGQMEATRCEKCDYCRATKKLKRIIDYRDLGIY